VDDSQQAAPGFKHLARGRGGEMWTRFVQADTSTDTIGREVEGSHLPQHQVPSQHQEQRAQILGPSLGLGGWLEPPFYFTIHTFSAKGRPESGDYAALKQKVFFFFFCSTGVWTQSLYLEHSTSLFFVMGFFKIGSWELFAWAGFKLWSSWPLPPKHKILIWALIPPTMTTFQPPNGERV
jgi:hypothetical protein